MRRADKEQIATVSRKVDRITEEIMESEDSGRVATLAKDLRKTAEELKEQLAQGQRKG
jgi:hypothetical protein